MKQRREIQTYKAGVGDARTAWNVEIYFVCDRCGNERPTGWADFRWLTTGAKDICPSCQTKPEARAARDQFNERVNAHFGSCANLVKACERKEKDVRQMIKSDGQTVVDLLKGMPNQEQVRGKINKWVSRVGIEI